MIIIYTNHCLIIILLCLLSIFMIQAQKLGLDGNTSPEIELFPDIKEYYFKINSRKANLFFIKPIKSSFYAFGSCSIKLCLPNCDFDVELRENFKDEDTRYRYWQKILWTVQNWIQVVVSKRDTSSCKSLESFSCYEEKHFTIMQSPICSDDQQQLHIILTHKVIDRLCLFYLLLGLVLFFMSSRLSKSVLFYYSSATVIGILASALVLIFILSRFVPKKPIGYSLLVGGWSLYGYIFSRLYINLTDFVFIYYKLVLGYVFIAGFLTFGYCYYHGPINNPRTHDVIRWSLKSLAIVLIYNSSFLPKASLAIISILLIQQAMWSLTMGENGKKLFRSISNVSVFQTVLSSRPKPRKFLTEDEYIQQGRIETQKALEELKSFCHSPQCSPWKTLSRLQSPQRFAKFIEGENHVTEEEITLHEQDMSGVFEDEHDDSNLMSEEDDSIEILNLDFISPSKK